MPHLRTVDEAGNEVCVDTISLLPEPVFGCHYYAATWSARSASGLAHSGSIVFRFYEDAGSLSIEEQTGLRGFCLDDDSEAQTNTLLLDLLWIAALQQSPERQRSWLRREEVSHE